MAGLPWNDTSSEAWSRRTSASAIGCGESQIAAARASARNSRFGESIRWTKADASGPSTKSSTRENQPPTRLSSSSVAAITTTALWTTTSRCRTCASSWASTASSSAGEVAENSPHSPRPSTHVARDRWPWRAAGRPASDTSAVSPRRPGRRDARASSAAPAPLRSGTRARAEAERDAIRRTSRARREQRCAKGEDREQPIAAECPADKPKTEQAPSSSAHPFRTLRKTRRRLDNGRPITGRLPARARVEASRRRARRSGWSSGGRRCSGAERGCGR